MLYTQEQVSSFKQQQFAYLQVQEEDHVLTITLNRPEKKNAMNPVFMNEIVYALSYAHYANSVWVVVLKANGDVFCAGADLKAFAGQAPDAAASTIPEPPAPVVLGDAFNNLHKPCIAQVHANVYAGGFLLICGCTHVVASGNAQFSLPEVKRGIWPMQVMASLKPIMPARKLLDLCMRARTLTADEAKELGLVTEVVAVTDLESTVNDLVAELKTFSPSAIRLGLKAWDELKGIPADKAHPFLLGMLQEILGTKDAGEGLQAFIEKRSPVWTGE
ncbi:MAG: enoyl-CoA hydratase-related protein [Chitinophagales bacterium]|nr:enoyl-CoA hydratase-related protein [Chitinophagales bacterium]